MPKVKYNSNTCYALSTASKILALETYVIRYWGTAGLITLNKNRAGKIFFTHTDIKKLLFIKQCLREDRLTIEGTKLLTDKWKDNEETQTDLEFT
jgi:DNA-binding transcriptional MerR regulator